MTDKATPTEWDYNHEPGDKWVVITDAAGNEVARVDHDDVDHKEAEANARLIVTAVNAHEALVKALKTAKWTLGILAPDTQPGSLAEKHRADAEQRCRKALKLTEEQ